MSPDQPSKALGVGDAERVDVAVEGIGDAAHMPSDAEAWTALAADPRVPSMVASMVA
jgi:hypothetical protein